MTEGPLQSYLARVAAGEMDEDAAQLHVARQLGDLAAALTNWRAAQGFSLLGMFPENSPHLAGSTSTARSVAAKRC